MNMDGGKNKNSSRYSWNTYFQVKREDSKKFKTRTDHETKRESNHFVTKSTSGKRYGKATSSTWSSRRVRSNLCCLQKHLDAAILHDLVQTIGWYLAQVFERWSKVDTVYLSSELKI
jgi:hypothetical protein